MDNIPLSPPPPSAPLVESQILMDFPNAIHEVMHGNKITRVSWTTEVSYGVLADGWLMIFIGGEFHKWTINDGDLEATDWIIYEPNQTS